MARQYRRSNFTDVRSLFD